MKFLTKKVLIIIGGILIFAYLVVSFYIASQVVSPGHPKIEVNPSEISANYEDVSFKATDGLKISGWLFKTTSNKLVIIVAGLNATRSNLPYDAPGISRDLLASGYNVLLYDPRGNGKSEGNKITLGLTESNDLVGAVAFAKTKSFAEKNIGIIGDSNGAVTTLLSLDRLPNIGAIVSDSSVSTFEPALAAGLWREHNVPFFFDPAIFFFDKYFFGMDIWADRPVDQVKAHPERKILFLHGEKDVVIPIKNSEELLAVAGKGSELVRFRGAEHVQTYKTNPTLYRAKVFAFLNQELSN